MMAARYDVLEKIRSGQSMSAGELITMIYQLSLPAIMAQLSTTIMEYIDASMVGHLGAGGSAAIGLVASSTWLFGGLNTAVTVGFSVPVAQAMGAGDEPRARSLVRQGMVAGLTVSLFWMALCVLISGRLPVWLGGDPVIRRNAGLYFLVFSLALPWAELNNLAGSFLQASGNMRTPSRLQILSCFLDVIFNIFLIFPTHVVSLGGRSFTLPGAGLGVLGAALGTALSMVICSLLMLRELILHSPLLPWRMPGEDLSWRLQRADLARACRLAVPMAIQQVVMSGAQVVMTRIISPLGTISIAAHSLAVTAEGLCYMPGYGIGIAATTIIGQSVGAKRDDLTPRLAWMITGFGMVIMSLSGILMYILADGMIGILSPDPEVRALGARVLRIEALAEPFFGASIVAAGALRGNGDTLVSSALNLFSIWVIRLPLTAYLALGRGIGLVGVWIAMCLELCIRGCLFLLRMRKTSFRSGTAEMSKDRPPAKCSPKDRPPTDRPPADNV